MCCCCCCCRAMHRRRQWQPCRCHAAHSSWQWQARREASTYTRWARLVRTVRRSWHVLYMYVYRVRVGCCDNSWRWRAAVWCNARASRRTTTLCWPEALLTALWRCGAPTLLSRRPWTLLSNHCPCYRSLPLPPQRVFFVFVSSEKSVCALSFSPTNPLLLASASTDKHILFFDIKQQK